MSVWDLEIGNSRVKLHPGVAPAPCAGPKPSPADALAVEMCTRAGHDPYSVVQVVAMRWREEWREIHNQTCGPLWELYRDKALWLRRRLAGDFHT